MERKTPTAEVEGEVGSLLPPPSPKNKDWDTSEDPGMEDGPFCPRCGAVVDLEFVYANEIEKTFAGTCQGPQGHAWNVTIGLVSRDISIFEAITIVDLD